MLDFNWEPVLAHLRIGKYFVQTVDGGCWNIFFDETTQPIVPAARPEDRGEVFDQCVVIFNPSSAVIEARICRPLRLAHHLEHVLPKLIRRRHMQYEWQT